MVLTLLACWSLVLLTWPGRIENPDALARYSLAHALVEDGSFAIKVKHINDEGYLYRKGKGGATYCSYPVMHSLLMAPLVWLVGGKSGAALVNPLLFPLLFLLIYSVLRRVGAGQWPALATTATISLCTMVWPYATYSHDVFIQAVFLLGAVRALLPTDRAGPIHAGVAGLGLGICMNVQPTAVLMCPALMVLLHHVDRHEQEGILGFTRRWFATILNRRTWLKVAALLTGLAPMAILFLWYDSLRQGNVAGAASTASTVVNWAKSPAIHGNLGVGVAGFLISPAKSIFLFAPPSLLAILLMRRFSRRSPALAAAAIVLGVTYLLGMGKISHWHGDWSWGPRYLLPMLPVFCLSLVEVWRPATWRKYRLGILTLLGLGFLIQLAGASVCPRRFFHERDMDLGFHMRPESRALYFSLDFMPTADAMAAMPLLIGRTFDGLFNQYSGLDRELVALARKHRFEKDPGKRRYWKWLMDRMKSSDNLTLDYWWLHQLLINQRGSVVAIVAPLLLFLVGGASLAGVWRLYRKKAPSEAGKVNDSEQRE